MIASLRGVLTLAAIAFVLAIIALTDRRPAALDHALVPGLDPSQITELVWQRDHHELRALRRGDTWQLGELPADATALGDVLAALRGARWHRRGTSQPVHATLTVVTQHGRHEIGIGGDLPGADQTWLTVGGSAVLVDRWVARALDRDALALRIRRPLADADRADHLQIDAIRLARSPWRRESPAPLLLAPELVTPLLAALRDIELVRLPDSKPGAATLTVAADTARLALAGPCPGAPDLVAITGSAGDGCITRSSATALEQAAAALTQPDDLLVEKRPAPLEPTQLTLPDGAVLDVTHLRIADSPADPARVAELLAALSTPSTPVARPAQAATQTLTVTSAHGTITLDLFAGLIARRDEPRALRPPPGAFALLTRPSRALRDPAPWLEEPTTITAIRIDDRIYQRGGTIGTWTRDATPADAPALDALALALATPRVLAVLDTPIAPSHRVTLTVTPPVGAPTHHDLALGPPRASGCPARVASITLLLPLGLCHQVAALAR